MLKLSPIYIFFSDQLYFLEKLSVHSQIEQKVQSSHILPDLTYTAFPIINNMPHQSDTFIMINEPTLTHNHPKSTVYSGLGFTLGIALPVVWTSVQWYVPTITILCR